MIKNSFIFIPGIGEKTEQYLWQNGILTWDDLEKIYLPRLNNTKREVIESHLGLAKRALEKMDSSFFAKYLPCREHWRMFKEFRSKTLFLDIETTGTSVYYDIITVIGTFDPHRNKIKIFLRNKNLKEIRDYLRNYEVIVTFNGKLFDIPFIKKEFPEIKLPSVHIDLRFLLRSLGFTGSLKEIEKKIGIRRKRDIEEVNGKEAAILWSKFVKGDEAALRKLLLYNLSDTINLEKLMQFAYIKKIENDILPKIKNNLAQQRLFTLNERKKFNYHLPLSNAFFPTINIVSSPRSLKISVNNVSSFKINKNEVKPETEIKIETLIRKIKKKGYKPLSVGIDLTGSQNKACGICILEKEKAYLTLLKTDEEIISTVLNVKPAVISIDSPLSLPKGRCCTTDLCECRKYGITRECERILKRRGINVYPCLIKSMQKLTARGIKLSQVFKNYGYQVIESYPGAAQDILKFPRKRVDLKELEKDLINMGIIPFSERKAVTHDEIDALTSALVGYFYLAGMYEAIGNPEEGYLILPDLKKVKRAHSI